MRIALRQYRARRARQRHHRRPRRAQPDALAVPHHPRARRRLRRRHRGRRDLRARGPAGDAGAVRPLGLLAEGAARWARSRWPTAAPCGAGSATPSPAYGASSWPAPSPCSQSSRIGLLDIRARAAQAEQFLQKPEAISAGQRLAEHFPAGSSDPAVVLTRSPDEATAALKDLDGVDVGDGHGRRQAAGPSSTSCSRTPPDSAAPGNGRADARARSTTSTAPATSAARAAEAIDEADASTRDRWVIFPVILALVLGALLLLLRSVVAPVLLVLTVLGTYVAALGASWWLFTGRLRLQRGRRRDAAAGLPVPGGARASTTTSSWSRAPGRRQPGTAPARGCCARSRPPVA